MYGCLAFLRALRAGTRCSRTSAGKEKAEGLSKVSVDKSACESISDYPYESITAKKASAPVVRVVGSTGLVEEGRKFKGLDHGNTVPHVVRECSEPTSVN
jgi:hypothetical protein